MAFSWTCPFCNRDATINSTDFSLGEHRFERHNKYGTSVKVITTFIVCPNPQCEEFTLSAKVDFWDNGSINFAQFQLLPETEMKLFPHYVPEAIRADYKEACLIRHQSPKASATLSRRCLQGMIRDFWNVKKGRLVDEIEAIQNKVDPTTWAAIDAIRKIGNIGAHMEKDINLIIDVDSEEAQLLIGLIEMLIKDWYIVKHEREQHLAQIIATAVEKDNAKASNQLNVTHTTN